VFVIDPAVTPMIDVATPLIPGGESQHRIGPIDVAADGILIGEHAPRESLTDDSDGLFPFLPSRPSKSRAGDDGNASEAKESGRADAQLRARILFAGA